MLSLEELNLLRENNKMLHRICDWIEKYESPDYQNNEDMKNMIINLIANSIIPER